MKSKYLIVALFSIFVWPCQMTEGYSIELVGSTIDYAGRVQFSSGENQGKSICDAGWDIHDAQVVCRELGYSNAEAAILGEAFGHAPGQLVAREFQCRGNEQSLSECPSQNTKKICNKARVAAVLCKPNVSDTLPVFLLIAAILGCLAVTSIIILIVTIKTMVTRKKRCIAKEKETVLPNVNIEEAAATATEDERELNKIENTISNNSFSYIEEKHPAYRVEVVDNDENKGECVVPISEAELIESLSSVETHHHDSDGDLGKRKESRIGRYMPLLKGSKTFRHFYEKLLKRNRIRESATDIDYAQDYYLSKEYSKDWLHGNVHDISDVDSTSNEEYHEIYPEEGLEKVELGGVQYVPMLSLSHMRSQEVVTKDEMAQDEYLNILPPNSPGSSKRDSDYLDPIEANLPDFPETSDDVAKCSYDEELPQPPMELVTSTNDNRKDKINGRSLELSNQECRCDEERDLMCKNCLEIHSTPGKLNKSQILMVKGAEKDKSEEDLEYMPMDHCSIVKNDPGLKVKRNSNGYAIPMKKLTKDERNHGASFPEELNKRLLNQKIINEKLSQSCGLDTTAKSEGRTGAPNKGYQGLPSPRNARKVDTSNEKLTIEKSVHLEKPKPNLSSIPTFSNTKAYFVNNTTDSPKNAKKFETFPRKGNNSEENESTFEPPNPTNTNTGKERSESFPIEGTTKTKPSASFLEALETALKGSGSKDEAKETSEQMEMEHNYELDYEDIYSPGESKYENDDFYSESRPSSGEYDYVRQKQRKSLHFYEAVSKHHKSNEFEEDEFEEDEFEEDEFEEDEYENI